MFFNCMKIFGSKISRVEKIQPMSERSTMPSPHYVNHFQIYEKLKASFLVRVVVNI